MLGLQPKINNGDKLKILCLGAHSDDIEIGCGGTLLKLIREYRNLNIYWVVLCAKEVRAKEAESSAKYYLENVDKKEILIKDHRDGFLPYSGSEIKDYFETTLKEISPNIIFTHQRNDLHQDHRLISDLTWNTFRDHLILEYEIPKYDGDLGAPNLFIELDEDLKNKKINALLEIFQSQRTKHWFTEELFTSMMRIRGMESGINSRYAEAFYCRKLLL